MKILFLGDVVGKVGRNAVINNLSFLKEKYKIDFTIVNGENSAHGKGITTKIYKNFKNIGVDVVTLGNHAFAKKEIMESLYDCSDLVRPVNLEPTGIGRNFVIKECLGKKIAVVNICGSVFMDKVVETPYDSMGRLLSIIKADIIFVDFHGEATAEKAIFFEYFRDKLTAVIGTHTHIQTADERIKNGCAFISDAGMCGAYDSILGRDIEEVFNLQIKKEPSRFKPAEGDYIVCGVVIEIDEKTNRSVSIERIQIRPNDA